MSTLILQLADLAVEFATGASGVIRDLSGAEQQVSVKSTDTDLVTETDRAVEQWLRDQIARQRPDDAIMGEEGVDKPGTSGVRWVVDPIDGTVNFVLGIPMYAVSVAAELDGRVVAGAVANPVSGELFRARLGGGAQLGRIGQDAPWRPLNGPRPVPLGRAVLGTGFGYDPARRARQIALATQVFPHIADIRRLGSAALDLCAVAAGRLDGYWEVGLNPWDYAAGVLVASEAGCATAGLDGGPASTALTAVARPEVLAELMPVLTAGGVADVL